MVIRVITPRAAVAVVSAEMDGHMRAFAAAAFAVLLAHWLFVLAFVVPRLGSLGFLRLHYTAAHGIDWVARWQAIFVFPALGFAAFFVNLVLAALLARTSRGLGRIVLGASFVIEALFAVGGALAVLLNG